VRKLLGISPGTLQNLRINGTLPYTKIGGVLFYDYEEIKLMIEQNHVQNKFEFRRGR
jgi:isocitrate dehydrogenase kinase/phosphatase